MELHVAAIVIVVICACAVSSAPATNRREDMTQLVSILSKIKDINRHHPASNPDSARTGASFPDGDSDLTSAQADDDALSKGFLGVMNKREGSWSYDYGLGGGRFGKRNYGDYGIGGGRFGRDVDHVDLMDTNDTS